MNAFEQFIELIIEHGGRCQWSETLKQSTGESTVECWLAKGKVIMVLKYPKNDGCMVFFPSDQDNNVDVTKKAITDYLNS